MSYSMQAERAKAREHLSRMVDAGPGWHPYALDRAEQLVREDPFIHGGLVAELEKQVGAEATKKARRAIDWFAGKGRG